MYLSELKVGEGGFIIKIIGHGGFRKQMIKKGFIKGQPIKIDKYDEANKTVNCQIQGISQTITQKEAEQIEIIATNGETEIHTLIQDKRRYINVALIGCPESGKTALFNTASGNTATSDTDTESILHADEVFFEFQGYKFHLIDLPSIEQLTSDNDRSLYVRHYLINNTPDLIINVVDATQIEKDLYLTTQLLDMNLRMVIALNRYDLFEDTGDKFDYPVLSKLIGTPIIPTETKTNRGIEQLLHVSINIYEGGDFIDKNGEVNERVLHEIRQWHKENVFMPDHAEHLGDFTADHGYGNTKIKHSYRHIHVSHGSRIENYIDKIKTEIAKNEQIRYKYSTRFLAINLLTNDSDIEDVIKTLPNSEEIFRLRDFAQRRILDVYETPGTNAIADAKKAFIKGALKETYFPNPSKQKEQVRTFDHWATHHFWGYVIFFTFLFLMFEGTYVLGEYPMKGINWLVEQLSQFCQYNLPEGPIKDMIVNGIIGGVGGVIVFLPNILLLYLFISLMEDTGYMARAAFIMDKVMHHMGLHGKSFIPLVMGFGCNVPAILATKSIESKKSRLITILITPLMSCSARLPIYIILIGAFFPQHASLVMLSIYAIGILIATIMSRFFNHFIVKGNDTPFVMELPSYQIPKLKNILRHTWEKGYEYLKKMGGIIMAASIIIWFLGYYPHHEKATPQQQQEQSYIGHIGHVIEPALAPCGFNWQLDIGLVAGTGAKELVVSTLGVLFSTPENVTQADSNKSRNEDSALELSLQKELNPSIALGYMLFVLLYFPCLATLGAIHRETKKWKWVFFTAAYTTTIAWIIAFGINQISMIINF
jgi:ferrous iron transport protein B